MTSQIFDSCYVMRRDGEMVIKFNYQFVHPGWQAHSGRQASSLRLAGCLVLFEAGSWLHDCLVIGFRSKECSL